MAVQMQVLDIDYVMVNERPVVRIFGRTAAGESVCGFYEGFLPYFYVKSDAAAALLADAVKKEKVQVREVGRREQSTFTKVTVMNPSRVADYRDGLQAQGFEVLEADILFRYRFMSDRDVRGMEWITMEGADVATTTVGVDRPFAVRGFAPADGEEAPLRLLALDIECVPLREGTVPEAKRDPVIMIALAFGPAAYKGRKTLVLSTRPAEGAEVFESEREMLEEFVRLVNGHDPDILTGYNCNNFDFPYLLERMQATGVKPVFGRCRGKQVFAKKVGARFKISIAGRIIVDSFEIVKKDFSLQRYDLDSVARRLLHKQKESVKHSEIARLWKGDGADVAKLVEYARTDAVLALDLVTELKLLDKYMALSKIAGTLLQDTIEGGETARIEHFLLKEFNRQGYVFPCRPPPQVVLERERIKSKELVGGYVIEPDKKLHSNVVVLDFQSMYPSIIRTFNICPTTLVKDGGIQTVSGARFLPAEQQKGIVPQILERLMEERQATKKLMRKAEGEKRRILYAKQWALKILANAFYGHLGYSRARIYDLEVANAITSCGRDIISKTVREVERLGYRVVYGDTDSVFVVVPEEDMAKVAERAQELTAAVGKTLPGIMTLQFEKVFKRFLPLTKKRYVAWSFVPAEGGWEEMIEMKGVETVRRDWCELVGETMGEVINIILKKEDVKEAVHRFKGIVNDLVAGKIPLQKLVVTKTMTKSAGHYVGMQPHIELVKKMQSRSLEEAPGIGDRVPYVIVKGTDLLSKRAEDPVYVMERGLQVDSHYYIENQLLPPLERIFAALNISKSELLGNGKQMALMDVLRSHGQAALQKQDAPVVVSRQEFTGFVCGKCSEFYGQFPLLGVCRCGGGVLFASRKGQGKVLQVN